MPEKRSVLIAARLTPSESTMLQELADAGGVYQSDVIRTLVRKAHAERFGTTRVAKPKRSKK
jgi:hypothetical protein